MKAKGGVRRHLTSIVFIVAAVLVSIYAYVVDRGKVSDPERNARGAALFPAFRRDEITRVELTGPSENLVLERGVGEQADWRMTSPVPAAAEPAAVEALLGALDVGNVIRRAEGQNFDKPRLRGTVAMGKVIYRFALGAEAPVPEGAAYVQLDGEGSFVVGRDLVTQLLKVADTYRERTIVPYLSIALRRLEVRAGETWAIERVDDVSFRWAPPEEGRISRDGIDRVWKALAETRAEVFISDAEAERGQEQTTPVVVVMTPKDAAKPPGELSVGGVCPGHPEDVIVVRRSPTRLSACAPKMVLDGLGTPKADLADKHLFAARFDEVEELILESLDPGGPKLEMARMGNGWHERSPEDRELSKDEVDMANTLVTQLVRGEGRLVDGAKETTSFTPRLRAVIGRTESQAREEVQLDRTPKSRAVPGAVSLADEFLVKRAADGALLAIDRELERKLEPRATALRGRELWTPPLEGKEVAAVGARCTRGIDQELVREGTSFIMRKPAGYPADNGGALDLFEAVAHTKAESWVADADDGTFGLAEGCRIDVGVKDATGTRTESLLLGRDAENGVYAQIAGRAPVFVAPKALKDMAARPLVDRNAFFIDPPKLTAVTLKRGDKSLTGTEPVFQAFSKLRAEEVSHLGPARPDEGFASPSLEVRATVGADAAPRTSRFVFGRATLLRDQKVYFARIDGIDATFLVAKERLDPFLDAF
ncbi:DUF4340 domain-containing protein [Pendulispora rubella]|uniref:DUF4340 domain-containing protein n=1 Tax=Pendulispora rubella TaxID=2741070 RepID=A0ABZ2L8P0_9BACT